LDRCRGGAAIVLTWEPGRRGRPDSPTIAGRSLNIASANEHVPQENARVRLGLDLLLSMP
jgi:hypothetical protein